MTNIFEISHENMTTQIVRDVFATMLGYEINESFDDYSSRGDVVTCAIFFAGVWKGALILECNEPQACFFTGRLMGIPEPAQLDDNARDAMGEVVNMVGGNLKSVLPPGVGLSMPSVLEGHNHAYRICGTHQVERYSFRGDAGPIWVTLVQVDGENN
jgi:CheY-specific phosphatase CheX